VRISGLFVERFERAPPAGSRWPILGNRPSRLAAASSTRYGHGLRLPHGCTMLSSVNTDSGGPFWAVSVQYPLARALKASQLPVDF
jgi:hypothetical protein